MILFFFYMLPGQCIHAIKSLHVHAAFILPSCHNGDVGLLDHKIMNQMVGIFY